MSVCCQGAPSPYSPYKSNPSPAPSLGGSAYRGYCGIGEGLQYPNYVPPLSPKSFSPASSVMALTPTTPAAADAAASPAAVQRAEIPASTKDTPLPQDSRESTGSSTTATSWTSSRQKPPATRQTRLRMVQKGPPQLDTAAAKQRD